MPEELSKATSSPKRSSSGRLGVEFRAALGLRPASDFQKVMRHYEEQPAELWSLGPDMRESGAAAGGAITRASQRVRST